MASHSFALSCAPGIAGADSDDDIETLTDLPLPDTITLVIFEQMGPVELARGACVCKWVGVIQNLPGAACTNEVA